MSQRSEYTAAMIALRHLEAAAWDKHPNEALHTTIARARETLVAESRNGPSDGRVYHPDTTADQT